MNLSEPLILDGAMGTQLGKRGIPQGSCPEKWILEHPEVVREIQASYIEAGSQIIYAPTFGANRCALQKHGIVGKTEEYNKRIVELSREIAGGRALVAGDISSTGGMLYPLGDMKFEQLAEIYQEQAEALQQAGVDLFVIETMTSVPEARAAVLAVKEVSSKPVFVTFSCDESGRSMMGTDVCAALVIMEGMGVDAFGLNCSTGPEEMAKQIRRLRKITDLPLIAKPNAGLPVIRDGKTEFDVSAEHFSKLVPELIEAGASIIGGCCGTDAAYIQGIKNAFEARAVHMPVQAVKGGQLCATEKDVFLLSPDIELQEVLSCSEDLEDDLYELEEEKPFGVEICCEEDIEAFSDVQYAIKNPLCIQCDDINLLEQTLRVYQGRAFYRGSLDKKKLEPLIIKYGLRVF